MDKYEYKLSVEEIKRLIKEGSYEEAAEIADTIDWRRVKSVMMLCTISDLYKINRRYEDARDVLLLAYEQRPGGRTICYSLCELCLKTDQLIPAMEYFKEFVHISPNDPGKFILQYKLYQAQGVSLEERIQVLEELKKKDYREKWAYELAALHHQVGNASQCVSECDELILWFGEGRYVTKAMELKMEHQPLTEEQQYRYDHRFDATKKEEPVKKVSKEQALEEENLVKTVDVGQFNTMNLQAELAAGLREVLAQETEQKASVNADNAAEQIPAEAEKNIDDTKIIPTLAGKALVTEKAQYDDSEEEALEEDAAQEAETEVAAEIGSGLITEIRTEDEAAAEIESDTDTVESENLIPQTVAPITKEMVPISEEVIPSVSNDTKVWGRDEVVQKLREINAAKEEIQEEPKEEIDVLQTQPPREMARVLSQESDGQISMIVPEREQLEKQITGQLSIEEVLADWEEMKRKNKQRHEDELRQRVLQNTGDMFAEFDAAVKNGLLEQLEKGEISGEEIPVEEITEEDSAEELQEEIQAEETQEEEIQTEEIQTEEIQTEEIQEEELQTEEISEEAQEELQEEEIPEEEIQAEETQVEETAEEEPQTVESTQTSEEETAPESMEEQEPSEESENEVETEADAESEAGAESEEEEPAEDETEENTEDNTEETDTEEPEEEEIPENEEQDASGVRALTKEEKELFAPYIQSKASRNQLMNVLDKISIASYTGNVIITGVAGLDTLSLAKSLVKEMQSVDNNFTGGTAKISGETLNKRNVSETVEKFKNGALIIEKASGLSDVTVNKLYQCLQKEENGIIVIMIDTKKKMNRFLESHEQLRALFNARMDLEAMSNDALANFGKKYANEREYAIDENLGMLALHTRIEDMQTGEHAVTILDVKEIVDEAIDHVNRKTPGHFFDILFGRRYDDEDMIILGEKDFAKKK